MCLLPTDTVHFADPASAGEIANGVTSLPYGTPIKFAITKKFGGSARLSCDPRVPPTRVGSIATSPGIADEHSQAEPSQRINKLFLGYK